MKLFKSAARKQGRTFSLLLVSLLSLTLSGIEPAPANAATIGNGEIISGSVTGAGTQSWNFSAPTSNFYAYIIGAINAPTPDVKFKPGLKVFNPDSTLLFSALNNANTYGQWGQGAPYPQTGTYSIQGYNGLGATYPTFVANFTMNIDVSNVNTWQSQYTGGGVMYPSVTYNATQQYASANFWSFAATTGDHLTVVSTPGTGYPTGGKTKVALFEPDGVVVATGIASSNTTAATANLLSAAQTGKYTVLTWNGAAVGPSAPFTLQMTGATKLSQDAKQDGRICLTCMGKKVIAAVSKAMNGIITSVGGATGLTDPINIATGNMVEQVTDYTTVGTNPLALIRTYNSMSYSHNLYPTLIGPNWRTNYDRYLRAVSSTQLAAEREDGQVINFALSGGVGTPDSDVDVKLTYSGSTYTLTDSDDTVEVYTVTSGKGTLNSITWPNGYVQTLNYTSGVLTSVSDSYSRSLSFTYTTGMLTGVTTPDSATLTYGYTTVSGQSLLTSVAYNTSPGTSQTYVYANTSLPFALTSITDENGNTNSQWTYDGNGRCTMSEHAGGADIVQVSYDDSGTGYRTVTDPLGNAETYHFTTLQGVSKVSSIVRAANSPVASATRNFTYDTNGYLATATDWNGNSTHWTNNSHGEPTSITEAYGAGIARTTTISYDSTWVHKPYTTTKTNVTIDDRYNATTGTLTSHTLKDTTGGSTNNQTHVWNYTYNSTGQMLTETFPRTGTTVKNTYTYTGGALTSITDQLSHAVTINTYNGTGQPTQITDPNSVVTNLVYNNRNWLTSKTVVASPSNEVTGITYRASGQPLVITLPDSSTITYGYDTAQRLTTITNSAGETINYTLNAAGKPTTTTIKDSGGTTKNSWTATYDVLGDMLTRVGAGGAGQTTTYAWDGNQNRTSVKDANSKTTSLAWDALNRPSTVTDPLTHTAAPTYNNLDYVTAQTDFLGYSTSYTRDAFGNAIARSSPDSGSWSFTFNEDNDLTGITDARSVATTNTFDAADRLTGVSITGYTGEAETLTYDATTSGNKGVGRLTSASDESGSTSRVYNNFGNITSETRVIGGKTYTISYSYDLANRLTEVIYPSGRYVDYTYDSSGYLTTVTTKPSSGGTVTTLASSITHKPFGPISGLTYGNSEALTKTFDNNYWLSTLNTVYSGTYVQELSYGQDNAGNLTSITDTLDTTRNETFTVDELNRLHTASGKYGSRTYTYDNNSNRATEVVGSTTYTYSNVTSKNRLDHYTDGTSTRNFTYTANGNMATDDRTFIGGGSVSNTFGGRDRLESQTVNSQGVTFKINTFGQRVSKAFSGTTTHYIHDIRGNIIAEANGSSGTTTTEYVWMEGQMLAQIDGSGNIVYVYSGYVNNPQKIANPSRALVWDRIQEPFGEDYSTPTNTTPTNHRFPGQYFDAENSLNYNNFRDYDRSIGRYIESDPLGLAAGPNLYSYAAQNPTQWVDPEGKDLKRSLQVLCLISSIFCGPHDNGGILQDSPSRAPVTTQEKTEKAEEPCDDDSDQSGAGDGGKGPDPEPKAPQPTAPPQSDTVSPSTTQLPPPYWIILVPFPGNPLYGGL